MHTGLGGLRRSISAALVCSAMVTGALVVVGQRPAAAEVTSVSGGAFGYYTDVSLFEATTERRGYGQAPTAPAESASPSVALPPGGSSPP